MAVIAVAVSADMIGWHALAAQSRRRRMAESAASRCPFEYTPRMTAVTIGAVMGAAERKAC